MKKNIVFFTLINLFCFLSFLTSAQNSDWIWAKSASGVGNDSGCNLALDSSDNVYIVGNFYSPIITFDTTTLTKISFENDIFITKYDNTGNVLWAKNAGVPKTNHMNNCICRSMTVDKNGNCIVTGTFFGDSMIFDKTILINGDDYIFNVFVVKYNTNGDVVWADCAKGATAEGISISSDSKGNSYLTGYFYEDSISFGNIIVKGLPPVEGVHGGIFLVKYDPDGNALWAHCFGETRWIRLNSISVDPAGNSYICGHMHGPSNSFGSITLTNTAKYGGIFLVKYDLAGNAIWAKTADESDMGGAECNSIRVDDNGNAYLTGFFNSTTITFGSAILTNTNSLTGYDPFYAKYDYDGNVLWVKTAGAPYITSDKIIGLDDYGNSYLTSNSNDDRVDLVDKFDAGGNLVWYARAYWGMTGTSICVDATGNSFITGSYFGVKAYFGSITLNNSVTNNNSEEFFIAKLSNLVTGISEYNHSSCLFNLYPTLAFDKITIVNNADIEKGIISIYSANGQLLLNKSFHLGKTELDISSFAKGIYLVRLETDKEIILKKVVKE